MQDRLQAELAEHYPDYGLLGEGTRGEHTELLQKYQSPMKPAVTHFKIGAEAREDDE